MHKMVPQDFLEVYQKALVRPPSKMILFKPRDAIDFVVNCEKYDVLLYGFESLRIYEDGSIQPFLEYTYAYNSQANKKNDKKNIEKAVNLLTSFIETDFFFDVFADTNKLFSHDEAYKIVLESKKS